jgi:hypothetical protein
MSQSTIFKVGAILLADMFMAAIGIIGWTVISAFVESKGFTPPWFLTATVASGFIYAIVKSSWEGMKLT